jgi:cell shape-determining protein MreC
MKTKKSLSSFSSIVVIPIVVLVIMLDKPDYAFFNFLYRNIVPVAEFVGQGITWPVRLAGKLADSMRKNRANLRENEAVAAELEQFHRLAAENEVLTKENELLRIRLNMALEIKRPSILAKVVHDNSFAGTQSFVIEGKALVGNIVLSSSGFLVGMISESAGRFSKIRSIRDSASNIPVRIAGTGVFGFVVGNGAADPELKFLSDGDFVPETGMMLISSGVNGNVPDGVPVGKIKSVGGDIIVEPGVELKNQESVFILMFDEDRRYIGRQEEQ